MAMPDMLPPLVAGNMAVPGPVGRALVPTGVYAAVRAHVERHRPTLVVLDTLADLFGGDEVIRADHAALKDGKEVFGGVAVLEATSGHVFLGAVVR